MMGEDAQSVLVERVLTFYHLFFLKKFWWKMSFYPNLNEIFLIWIIYCINWKLLITRWNCSFQIQTKIRARKSWRRVHDTYVRQVLSQVFFMTRMINSFTGSTNFLLIFLPHVWTYFWTKNWDIVYCLPGCKIAKASLRSTTGTQNWALAVGWKPLTGISTARTNTPILSSL